MKIFITGIAGFIGFHLAKAFHKLGIKVTGIDNFNDYYDPKLKKLRQQKLLELGIKVIEKDLKDLSSMRAFFEKESFTHFYHLAAQAGVRYSLINPKSYIDNNLLGFYEALAIVKDFQPMTFIFASSSSVYGQNKKVPFSELDPVDNPVSLYAATKKSNELLAYSYHHLYKIKTAGLRFFTVYGPYGRPDMAYYSFSKAILQGDPIQVFNHGQMERDFTYIDDIISGCLALLETNFDYEIFNLGNSYPEKLMTLIQTLEELLGKKANLEFLPMQQGDVYKTYADISKAKNLLGYNPKTSLKEGLDSFTNWFQKNTLEAWK